MYVKQVLQNEGSTVATSDGKTVSQVFHQAGIKVQQQNISRLASFHFQLTHQLYMKVRDLSLQTLGVGDGTDAAMWQRFDKFNEKYEPFGIKSLREIFLKHDNAVNGRFLADITKEVIGGETAINNHVYLEPRLSIYGRSENEWDILAAWLVRYNLFTKRVKWMVQIPRIFRKLAEALASKDPAASSTFSFQTLLRNIFKPLFEVTQNPQSHPDLHKVIALWSTSRNIISIRPQSLTYISPVFVAHVWI
jgi:adenosine deaminase